jgi:hypothetical protein
MWSYHPTYRLWTPTSRAGEGGTGPHLVILADVGRVVWTPGRDWPQAGCAGWRGRLTIAACTQPAGFELHNSCRNRNAHAGLTQLNKLN